MFRVTRQKLALALFGVAGALGLTVSPAFACHEATSMVLC